MQSILTQINTGELLTRLVSFLPDLVTAILILFGFWLFFRMTRRSVRAVLRRAGFHEVLMKMLVDNIYRFTLILVALVMAADQIGINVAAALAGMGVAGIAVGFAAQDSLANTLAGFLIFWDKPFAVGDWVRVSGEYGQVSEITMRSTRIATRNNTYVVIPNRKIIDEVLVNNTKHGAMRLDVPVGIAYKEEIPAARRVILAAVAPLADVVADPAPEVAVVQLGASSVDLEVRVWLADPGREQPAYSAVMEASKRALDAAGIEIPYHHLQLFIERVDGQIWEQAGALREAR